MSKLWFFNSFHVLLVVSQTRLEEWIGNRRLGLRDLVELSPFHWLFTVHLRICVVAAVRFEGLKSSWREQPVPKEPALILKNCKQPYPLAELHIQKRIPWKDKCCKALDWHRLPLNPGKARLCPDICTTLGICLPCCALFSILHRQISFAFH